ncbi:MAG: hypothetical protein AAGH42_09795 [Pseudomonadota bacterium]
MSDNRADFSQRLELISFALGFTEFGHHRRGKLKGQIDPWTGQFAALFIKEMYEAWNEEMPRPDAYPDDDYAKIPPQGKNNETERRWFRGETNPQQKQLPGIVETLQTILTKARDQDHHTNYLTNEHADDDVKMKNTRFIFTWQLLDPAKTPFRKLASEMGVDISAYDEWKAGATSKVEDELYDKKLRRYRGYYHAYRFHADEENVLQQNVVVIREARTFAGLEMYFFGDDDIPWYGEISRGQNTLSVLLKRTGGPDGDHVNTMSLVYEEKIPNLLHGFRSRILNKNPRHIAAYRIILIKQEDERYDSMIDADFSERQNIRSASAETRAIDDPHAPPGNPILPLIIYNLLAAQLDEIDTESLYASNAYNLCSIDKPLREYLRSTVTNEEAVRETNNGKTAASG